MKNKIRSNNESKILYAELSYLELVVHVELIFNDVIMNSRDSVVGTNKMMLQNIDELERNFRKLLKYFDDGLQAAKRETRKIVTMLCCSRRRRGN